MCQVAQFCEYFASNPEGRAGPTDDGRVLQVIGEDCIRRVRTAGNGRALQAISEDCRRRVRTACTVRELPIRRGL